MSARIAVLPRLLAIVVVCLLATAAVTFAAGGTGGSQAGPAAEPAPAEPTELVVPDVRRQAYIFAKGTLEDEGFAWKVVGPVQGYAANTVVSQSPAPGTRVAATGAPTVTLELSRNAEYGEKGEPENESPYAGTDVRLAPLAGQPVPESALAAPGAKPKPAAKPATKASAKRPAGRAAKKKAAPTKSPSAARPPAFDLSGAPKEPLDEIPLDARARRLAAWVEQNPKPTDARVQHWLYQHSWIVTGARFGWWRGAEALEILVQVDRRVERLWGVGSKSRRVADAALKEVRARS